MKEEPALYWYIDNNQFGEWLAFDVPTKIIFISRDIEVNAKQKYKQSLDRSESVSDGMVKELMKKFEAKTGSNIKDLKKIYTDFIEKYTKPDKKIVPKGGTDEEEEQQANYSTAQANKAADELHRNEERNQNEKEYLQERTKHLNEFANQVLSNIEQYALDFLIDRHNKHTLLNNFTLTGIVQIANRAAYKVRYLNVLNPKKLVEDNL